MEIRARGGLRLACRVQLGRKAREYGMTKELQKGFILLFEILISVKLVIDLDIEKKNSNNNVYRNFPPFHQFGTEIENP